MEDSRIIELFLQRDQLAKYTQNNDYFYEDMTLKGDKLKIRITSREGEEEIIKEYPVK